MYKAWDALFILCETLLRGLLRGICCAKIFSMIGMYCMCTQYTSKMSATELCGHDLLFSCALLHDYYL